MTEQSRPSASTNETCTCKPYRVLRSDETDITRWQPFRLHKAFGLQKTEWWGLHDTLTNPCQPLHNWTKRGSKKGIWRGTFEEAVHLAQILDTDTRESARITRPDTSLSQRIMYRQNQAQRTARSIPRGMGNFQQCPKCGSMYKGAKHCD